MQFPWTFEDLSASWATVAPTAVTVAVYASGIALYTAVVFTFYERISRRRLTRPATEASFWRRAARVLETLSILPVIAFAYFCLLAVALSFLAKARATEDVITLALSVVVGIRLTSLLGHGMAVDLAKLLPLGLLAVVLVDPGYFELDAGLSRVREALELWTLFAWGAVALVVLETVLQTIGSIRGRATLKSRRSDGRDQAR